MDHLNRHGEGELNKWSANDLDGGTTLRVGFPQSWDEIPEELRILDGIDTPLTAFLNGLGFLGDTHQERVELAAQTWADLANVRFEFVEPGETADIYVYGLNFANAYGPAFASAGGISTGPNYDYGTRIAINTTNGWPSMEPGASDDS